MPLPDGESNHDTERSITMRYRVSYIRYADRQYTHAKCVHFYNEETQARGFIANLLDGFKRGALGHDIDCDSIALVKLTNLPSERTD